MYFSPILVSLSLTPPSLKTSFKITENAGKEHSVCGPPRASPLQEARPPQGSLGLGLPGATGPSAPRCR